MALAVFAITGLWHVFYSIRGYQFRDCSPDHILKTAEIVYIQPRILSVINGQHVEINGSTIADLDAQSNPQMLASLHQIGQFHSTPPSIKPDFTVRVLSYGGQHWIYEPQPVFHYVSQTGEIGTGATWWYVSSTFKAWLLAVKAKLPSQRLVYIKHVCKFGSRHY